MTKKHYDNDELDFKDFSREHQNRTRKIFEDLKEKAKKNEELLEREKNFFCLCLKLSDYQNEGNPEDFTACDNFLFKSLYLTYFASALKANIFYKPYKGKLYEVPHNEKLKDFKYLQKVVDLWKKEIEKTNHTEQTLQILASETRNELKEHKKKSGKLLFRRQKEDYYFQKDKLILHSKFIYLLVKELFEDSQKQSINFNFLSKNIEIDSYSIIHIVNRHYSKIIKNNAQKSYHIEDFYPDKLHLKLEDILTRIDKTNLLSQNDIEKIAFTFNGKPYQIWIKQRTKQEKGKGNILFYRLESFYPIEDTNELNKINYDYTLIKIDNEIGIYIKK